MLWLLTLAGFAGAVPGVSIFEPVFRQFTFLPDYYLRFDVSTFALHRDEFFKRQYLAEPHPDLEFKLVSFRNIVSSVWDVDFLFGLGEVPGNNVFTVLNVAFGIDPKIELNLPNLRLSGGLAHHCYHEVDKSYFPLVHNNRLHLEAFSPNYRANEFFRTVLDDTLMRQESRIAWQAGAGYYLKKFFGLVEPGKLNGNSPLIAEVTGSGRYAFARRRSWIFSLYGETTLGVFDLNEGYHSHAGGSMYWKQATGLESYFSRGKRGACFYVTYHLDDLPVPPEAPEFTLGNSRFSKNGLAQIGIRFFN
jgi:hypothetical protein